MSEGLDPATKASMTEIFDCVAVSRYSNVENGILAQQPADGAMHFVINTASYCIEVLQLDTNQRVAYGAPGRIVVTDLYNLGMPIIRYDTGDIGVLEIDPITGREVLVRIEGRRMDSVFDTKGQLVSSFTITNQMWKYPEIIQYQFIQKGERNYQFILNVKDAFKRERELIDEFKNYFGIDAVIGIDYTQEIPLLHSGKRKKVKNEYTKHGV
jgi:phenylacetate-CoA ligase